MSSVKTERKQKPQLFKPGQSGNPRGRPPGARSRATVLAEAMLEGQLERVVSRIVEKAIDGDMTAARMVLDRLMPAPRSGTIRFALPEMRTLDDVASASSALIRATAAGEVSPLEAEIMQRLIEQHVAILTAAAAAQPVEVEIRKFGA